MANGYTINRSNYTLKKRRQVLSGGVVYERDFMTTTNLGGWDSGSIPYGESNFKMSYRNAYNAKKNLHNGDWLENPCASGEVRSFWTAECVGSSGAPEQTQIKERPNVNSILDFVYYGSCTELIKSTVTKIILSFPAEVYVESGEEYGFEKNLLENEFGINFYSKIIPEGEKNVLRYFLVSYGEYEMVDTSGNTEPIINVEFEDVNLVCGEYKVKVFTDNKPEGFLLESKRLVDGQVFIFTDDLPVGYRIRPKSEHIEKFFENLDDFSKILLNRNSNPVYTAVLDYPYETDRGVETYKRTITWPTVNDWNLAISGQRYKDYLDTLLNLSAFYDEFYTDNLWRMLTHDSLKAMDLTFSNPQKDEDSEDYNMGVSRFQGILWAIGRQFDDIRRAITNVKSTSNISYDGNNNVPDYFLSDVLSLAGFEVYNIDNTLSKEEKTGQIFDGVLNGYNASDANLTFLRNLKLIGKDVLKKKGTRESIESILGIFGMISKDYYRMLSGSTMIDTSGDTNVSGYDYEIKEYIGVIKDSSTGASVVVKTDIEDEDENTLPLERFNMYKEGAVSDTEENSFGDSLYGLPAAIKYAENGENIVKYIIPWFDKNKLYDGNLYYQAYGGWGRNNGITNSSSGYDETIKYLIVVSEKSDLANIPYWRLCDKTYAYVNNSEETEENLSNYFYLENKEEHEYVGQEDKGWKNLTVTEAEEDKTIEYLEHIVEDFKANNPHVGYGEYDSGKKYIDYLKNPLKYSTDLNDKGESAFIENAYDCDGNLLFSGDTFDIEYAEDNMKVWYFNPLSKNGEVNILNQNVSDEEVTIGESGLTFTSDAYGYDFVEHETTDEANEITADSLINTKVIKIIFYIEAIYGDDFKAFLVNSVLPYLRQVIPSTAIFEYEVQYRNDSNMEVLNTTGGVVVADASAIAGDETNDGEDDIIINYEEDRNLTPQNNETEGN